MGFGGWGLGYEIWDMRWMVLGLRWGGGGGFGMMRGN